MYTFFPSKYIYLCCSSILCFKPVQHYICHDALRVKAYRNNTHDGRIDPYTGALTVQKETTLYTTDQVQQIDAIQ